MTLSGQLDRMLLGTPEQVLNRGIRESTMARELLATLAGETLTIEVLGLGLTLGLVAHPTGIELTRTPGAGAAVTVRGAPLDLVRLLGGDPSAALRASRTEVSGQLELAQKFADLLRLARPDAEQEAARWIGDVPAHELARALGATRRWVLATLSAAERSLVEYLQEEGRDLPGPLESRALFADVEKFRDDVERLMRRVELLERASVRRD